MVVLCLFNRRVLLDVVGDEYDQVKKVKVQQLAAANGSVLWCRDG